MLSAEEHGELLTYRGGHDEPVGFVHHRISRDFGDRSQRSGPSVSKVAQDVELARWLARHPARDVVAHHVEAAAVALATGRHRVTFVAHTDLALELPSYFSPRLRAPLARLGAALDVALCRSAHAVLAVSPLLSRRLADSSGVQVEWLPIPWAVPEAITDEERADARARLGVRSSERMALYVGNLDAYQGLREVLAALTRQGLGIVLCVATASRDSLPPSVLRIALDGSEAQRRTLHAACDVALVPREAEGGLPVKLLDALARGVRVVASPRALGGLEAPVLVAADSSAEAFARAVAAALASDDGSAGPSYVRSNFSVEAYRAALARARVRAVRVALMQATSLQGSTDRTQNRA
jgi:glycosyltransferase involved in cell wall biosynthesis